MNPARLTGPRTLAVVLATAMIAIAGCDNNTPSGAHPSASASTDARAAWLDVAKCMRANGYPNFPDPVQIAQGVWDIPQSTGDPAGDVNVPACDALIRKAKQGTNAAEQPSARDMAKLRQYAKCMRAHGMPNHPDPDSDGNFGVDDKSPAWRTANEACKQYAPPQRRIGHAG
jgi:hypothetical protein